MSALFSEQTTTTTVVNSHQHAHTNSPPHRLNSAPLLRRTSKKWLLSQNAFPNAMAAADVVVDDLDGHEYLGQLFLSLNACDGVTSYCE